METAPSGDSPARPRPSAIDFELPQTAAAAYDLLQQMFGTGTYTGRLPTDHYYPDSHEQTWHQARAIEIAKIKRLLTRRRTSPEQLGKAAWYARREGIHVATAARLMPHVNDAIRAWNAVERDAAHARHLDTLASTIEAATAAGGAELVGRLLRADHVQVHVLLAELNQAPP